MCSEVWSGEVSRGSRTAGETPRAAAIATRSSTSQRRWPRSVRLRAVLDIGRPSAVHRTASWCWVRPRTMRIRSMARAAWRPAGPISTGRVAMTGSCNLQLAFMARVDSKTLQKSLRGTRGRRGIYLAFSRGTDGQFPRAAVLTCHRACTLGVLSRYPMMHSPLASAPLNAHPVRLRPAPTDAPGPDGTPRATKVEDVAADFLVNGRSASTVIPPSQPRRGN